ncbi:MAG: TetR/AcrR family transcriptional regulator [Gemmatimonadales bacterium]|nr:TetR/AcrR family transcriptional regulator [Gemmatimonadales bacterium]
METGLRSRKTDILRAAEREFASAGWAGGRVERIAAAAGVNKQLLFHYFKSKEGLFTAAVSGLLGRLRGDDSVGDSPSGAIKAVITDLLDGLRAAPGVVGIVAGARSDSEFPLAAAALVRDWRDRLLARLGTAVTEGQRRGYFRDDVDPNAVSAVATAAAIGLVALELDGSTSASSGSVVAARTLTQLLADYCAWR